MNGLDPSGPFAEHMTVYPRLRMRLALIEQETIGSWRRRPIEPADAPAVGALMLSAYRGTVDDEGESEADAVAEAEGVMNGEYGPLLADCSFAVETDAGRIVGASLVTLLESNPTLTYLVVQPEMKRRGIGTFLLASSGNALVSAAHSTLDLFVTEANEPAVNLYEKLGFQVVDRVAGPDPR
jgi:ribosomal protein S18 acetylase RimI-like enzyme